LHSNTFEGIAFSLNSILGTEVFVEAVGLGKGKDDLTEFVTEQSKQKSSSHSPRDCLHAKIGHHSV
jgi:hypothetical protein